MSVPEEEKREAIERILSPRTGRSKNRYGAFEVEGAAEETVRQLAISFLGDPTLFYDLHRNACSLLVGDVEALLETYRKLPDLLTPPEAPHPNPSYTPLRQILQQIKPNTPPSSPLFQSLWREIEKVQGPPSTLGQRFEKKREEAMRLVLALQAAEDALVQRVDLLVEALSSFEALDLTAKAMKSPLEKALSWAKSVEQEGSPDGGLQALAIAAAFRSLQTRRRLGKYSADKGTVSSDFDNDHPRGPARLWSLFGPFVLQEPLRGILYSRTRADTILIPASKRAQLDGLARENYVWVDELLTSYGSFNFGGDYELAVFIKRADGTTVDGSLTLFEGNYTANELAAVMNNHWYSLGLEGVILASAFPFLEIRTAPGAYFVIAPCPGAFLLGLLPKGGFQIRPGDVAQSQPSGEGPFAFNATNNTLVLSAKVPGKPASLVEVEMPTGGSVTVTDVRAAINLRLQSLGLLAFEVVEIDGKLQVAVTEEVAGYEIALAGGTALPVLGWAPEQVASIYPNRDLYFYLQLPGDSEIVVTVTLPDGEYSAKTLAEAITEQLGGHYEARAVGIPGYRSISISYLGPQASQASMRGYEDSTMGLSRNLELPTAYKSSGDSTSVQDLETYFRANTSSVELSLVMDRGDLLKGVVLPGTVNQIRLYREKGAALVLGDGSQTVRARRDVPWNASVGDVVSFSGTLQGATLTVTGWSEEGNELHLDAPEPMSFPEELESYLLGPSQATKQGYFLESSEAPFAGMYEIKRVVDPLTVEVNGIFSAVETETSFREGRVRLLLSDEGQLEISPLDAAPWHQIFPRLSASPVPEWVRFSEENLVEPGDLFLGFDNNSTQPILQATILETDGLWSKLDLGFEDGLPQIPVSIYPSPDPRTVVVGKKYLLWEQFVTNLHAWKDGLPERRKLWSAVRSSAYKAVSVARPHPYLLASLVQACRQALLDMEAFQDLLKAYQQDVSTGLQRLFDTLQERGATGTLAALRRCDFQQAFREDAFDLYQQTFDLLRSVVAAYMTRSMEEEEAPEEIFYEDEEEEYALGEDEDVLWHKHLAVNLCSRRKHAHRIQDQGR